jgi:hypothetical protein
MDFIIISLFFIITILSTIAESRKYKREDFTSVWKYVIYIVSNFLFASMMALFLYCSFVSENDFLLTYIFFIFNFSIILMSFYVEDLVRNKKREIYISVKTLRILRNVFTFIIMSILFFCIWRSI